ncbi:MAG TPA: F0F1 ATP synthase subunit A [Actinomycetota bacterium]
MFAGVLAPVLANVARPPEGFQAPGTGIFDYSDNCLFGSGSYCITRPTFWVLVSAVIIAVLFVVAFRRPKLVPRGLQNAVEALVDFIRNGIVMEVIGPEGLRFVPLLTSLFVFIWVNNTFEVVPFIQFPPTAKIAIPLVLTGLVYVLFNVVGVARQGGLRYLKGILFPPGVPWYIYPLYSPIELVSVFVVRPLTLSVRLTANMIAGHLILTVFFLGTWYLQWKLATMPFAAASFALGTLITGFELLVGVLQAYIFTILTAVYIAGAIHPEH